MFYSAICHEMRPLLGSLATSKSSHEKLVNSDLLAFFFRGEKVETVRTHFFEEKRAGENCGAFLI